MDEIIEHIKERKQLILVVVFWLNHASKANEKTLLTALITITGTLKYFRVSWRSLYSCLWCSDMRLQFSKTFCKIFSMSWVQSVSNICKGVSRHLSQYKYMYYLNPSYFGDIRTILINRLPSLSDEDLDIILDVFMSM